jgi:serine/threonine protein kinase
MTQAKLAGENREQEVSGGRTVVVGVKIGPQSRELLTWTLVKVAEPGDSVIALHVLSNQEIVDREGKSSLLSLVKAFDSVIAVYEGFCNLKQVDLKLKVCRGSSIQKIIVREAKSYNATEVIVGTSHKHHTIRSSASVAKHCAKQLHKDCTVFAVSNGKIVFQRESSSPSKHHQCVKENEEHRRKNVLGMIQRSLSKNSRVLNDEIVSTCENLMLAVVKANSESIKTPDRRICSICSPESPLPENNPAETADSSGDDEEDNLMAIVPLEASSSSISLLRRELRQLPELRSGWTFLRRIISTNRVGPDGKTFQKVSVAQWAMKVPQRNCLQITNSDEKEHGSERDEEGQFGNLNGENGAIVLAGDENGFFPSSPNRISCSLPKELEGFHEKYAATCRLFNYKELMSATSNFKPENMIGKGGSSQVYRGCLPDGKELAVKILKQSDDVLNEFVLEIEIITTLHHKNIISLFGFCFENNHLLLVYDFLSKGSLEENLHFGNKNAEVAFGWSERYKVAIGVAEALDYLHNKNDKPVIHRDIKSSNILLSDDFEPQLSDFGLAKWASTTSSHVTCTDVAGTFGYLAPEYFMYGKVNSKIDVYAFGVVLLELLSGRKPISNEYPKGQESLVMWAKPILNNGKFGQLLDSSLIGEYNREEIERMVLAATLCIRRSPRARPHMALVVKILKGDNETMKWARLEVNAPEGSYAKLELNPLEGSDAMEEEGFSQSNLQSHLNLALLDVDSSCGSMSSIEQSVSFEDYLRGRWSRSPSFD